MIQARSIYGGWSASVFSSAKNDNRIGWVQFLKRGIVDDTYANREEKPRKHSRDYSDQPKRPAFEIRMAAAALILVRKTRRFLGREWRLHARCASGLLHQ